MPRIAVALFAPLAAWAQLSSITPRGTTVKNAPTAYEFQAVAGDHTIAADYLVRTFGGEKAYFTDEYLVVEVAFFGPKDATPKLDARHFQLRLNGNKKDALSAAPPGMVGAAIKWADWEQRRTLEAYGSVGNGGVVVGRPPEQERFPGDPRPGQRHPGPRTTSGKAVEQEAPQKPEEAAVYYALPEGEIRLPWSGLLYFPWKGKPSKLKSVEMLYTGPIGEAVLKLK